MRTFSVITVIIISCCFLAVCTGFAAEARSNWATEAFERNRASVVFIQGDKTDGGRRHSADSERTFNGMGTGVIIDERGYIITNYHVVKDIRQIQVTTYDQRPTIGTVEHQPYIAELVAKDTETDLAVIKIKVPVPLRPIALGRSHDLMPGEACMAIGNPYGYAFSLTNGLISAIDREVGVNDSPLVYRRAIQTNTEINPGNSGGPLINVSGEMIGINVAIRQGALGIAFAIPVDQVVDVAAKLIGELVDQNITHGLKVSQLEPKDYNAIKRFFIRVDSVESNSPAALAGIQQGDFLSGIGEYTVRNKLDFYRALLSLKPNEDTALTFIRNNEKHDVAVVVKGPKGGAGGARGAGAFAHQNISPKPATITPKTASNTITNEGWDQLVWENFGIRYTPIPTREYEQIYSKFTLRGENASFPDGGVVVKAVRPGSPAAQAGLIAQDIIVAIENWAIASANDVRYVGGQSWKRLQSETDNLRADVIRDTEHFFTDIPTR